MDSDADGTADRVLTYSVFTDGRPGQASVDLTAVGAAGSTEGMETYAYDAQGRLQMVSIDGGKDFDGDGTADVSDGTVDRTESYVHNAGGRVIRTDYDDNADGDIDRVAFDDNADFAVDRTESHTHVRNAAGQAIRTGIDDDQDGTPDRVESYALDESGRAREKFVFELPLSRDLSDGPLSAIENVGGGGRAAPAFGDVDGNGAPDLVIGARNGRLHYYQNDDGTFQPQAGAANPFNGFDVGANAAPAFADLDKDGDEDLVVGAGDGTLRYYRKNDSGTFEEQTGAANPFNGFDAGDDAAPAFADADGDGDLDLVVGNSGGTLHYYKNTSATALNFTRQTGDADLFARVNVSHLGQGHSAPAFADLDGDGDPELAAGQWRGLLAYYRQDEDGTFEEQSGPANPFFELLISEADANGNASLSAHGINVDRGMYSAPAFADLDGDGMPELVVGARDVNTGSASLHHYVPVANRVESYTHDASGRLTHTRYDDDNDGVYERLALHTDADGVPDAITRYRRDANGRIIGIDKDENGDGADDLITDYALDDAGILVQWSSRPGAGAAPHEVSYHNEFGERIASGRDNDDADMALNVFSYATAADVVSELQAEVLSPAVGRVDARELAGVPLLRLAGADVGSTDLTISDEALVALADGDAKYRLRIIGDREDTLRFEMDDFNEGAAFAFGGEQYRQFFSGTINSVSFIVDPDVTLIDVGASRPELTAVGADILDDMGVVIGTSYDDNGDGHIDRSHFDPGQDGTVDRIESYARSAGGTLAGTRFDDDADGAYDRYHIHREGSPDAVTTYQRDGNGRLIGVDQDTDGDGVSDVVFGFARTADGARLRFSSRPAVDAGPSLVAYSNEFGERIATGQDNDDEDLALNVFSYAAVADVVSELRSEVSSPTVGLVDARELAGVPLIELAGPDVGSTDLTISDAALGVLAGGDADYQLRIDGDWEDALRFDMDDFNEGDAVAFDGEAYRRFAGTTGSFIVDPDVTLVDI